jgi:hypothetical protein
MTATAHTFRLCTRITKMRCWRVRVQQHGIDHPPAVPGGT